MKSTTSIKEDRDNSWDKFNKTGTQIYFAGKKIDFPEEDYLSIYKFCPHAGCNVFHHKDLARALIDILVPFTVHYWSLHGRDRYCEITVHGRKDHYLKVYASGYGAGDGIVFSKGFPPLMKFKLLRELALDNARDHISYCKDYPDSQLSAHTTFEVLYNEVRSIDDLFEFTKIISCQKAKKMYSKWKNKDKGIKKSAKRCNEEWRQIIKTPRYQIFLKMQAKARKELKQREARENERRRKQKNNSGTGKI